MFNSNLTHIIMVEFLLIAINNLVTKINLNINKGLKIIILIRNYVFLPTINSSVLLKAFIKRKSG